MTKKYLAFVVLLLAQLTVSAQVHENAYPPMKWSRIKGDAVFNNTMASQIPEQARPEDVIQLLDKARITHSELEDGVIYASVPAKSPNILIEKMWLVEFRFDESSVLDELLFKPGYTGP
jgi:hypothetical protein